VPRLRTTAELRPVFRVGSASGRLACCLAQRLLGDRISYIAAYCTVIAISRFSSPFAPSRVHQRMNALVLRDSARTAINCRKPALAYFPRSFSTQNSPARMPAKTVWDPTKTPYPAARRDEDAGETYKSKEKGEVSVKEPYVWLHEVRWDSFRRIWSQDSADCDGIASKQERRDSGE
jgi:hypothetical protein